VCAPFPLNVFVCLRIFARGATNLREVEEMTHKSTSLVELRFVVCEPGNSSAPDHIPLEVANAEAL
jgi:hypothetical protein